MKKVAFYTLGCKTNQYETNKMIDLFKSDGYEIVDFDSFAEVGKWLEKRGRQNKFYDGATRDVIDETIKNIENYNQRLYINEGGIGDEITQRIKALNSANEKEENTYGLQENFNLDEYDNAGYNFETTDKFLADEEDEDGE